MKTKNITRFGALLLAVVLMGSLLLSSCDSAGSGGGGDPAVDDPGDVAFDATADALVGIAVNAPEPYGGYALLGSVFYQIFVGVIDGWDGSSATYAYGDITVSVSESGGVWTWTFTDTAPDPDEVMVFTIEETATGWDFTWTLNGATYFTGSMSSNGLEGSLSIYDPDTTNLVATYEWGAGTGYALEFTIEVYTGGAVSDRLVIQTTLDGSTGEWTYTDIDTPENNDIGTW